MNNDVKSTIAEVSGIVVGIGAEYAACHVLSLLSPSSWRTLYFVGSVGISLFVGVKIYSFTKDYVSDMIGVD